MIGILFALGAAALYATVMLLNKTVRQVSGLQRTFIQLLSAAIVLVPYTFLSGGVKAASLSPLPMACLLTVGVLHTGLAYCLYFPSVSALPGQRAAILSYLDPLVAVILSATVLGEGITALQILGGVFVLGSALWNELADLRERLNIFE